MAECRTCGGNGYYAPKFSPDVLVNCTDCNADFSKDGAPPPAAHEMQRAGATPLPGME